MVELRVVRAGHDQAAASLPSAMSRATPNLRQLAGALSPLKLLLIDEAPTMTASDRRGRRAIGLVPDPARLPPGSVSATTAPQFAR